MKQGRLPAAPAQLWFNILPIRSLRNDSPNIQGLDQTT